MTDPIVTLTSAEMTLVHMVAGLRQVSNEAMARRDAHGASVELGLDGHIQGAAAEAAVAKYLNRWWSGALNNLGAADVGQHLQVRSTQHEKGCLILHRPDPDDHYFILAVGRAPTFRLAGWIRAAAGKDESFWRDPKGGRPAFFVPQSALERMKRQGARGASPQKERAPTAPTVEAPIGRS